MELPSKLLEPIVLNTKSKIEELMLIVMDKPTHEEHLSQPLQTNIKQFKNSVTSLTGYIGIFHVTNSNIKFNFKRRITDGGDFIQFSITPGGYEIESLNKESRRNIIEEEHFTESDYPIQTKARFSTLGSFIEISPQGPTINFVFDDSIRNLLGVYETILYKEYNLRPNPVDILPFDNIFLEGDIANGMIYKQERSGINHIWTMSVNPGYKYVKSIAGGSAWCMMEKKMLFQVFPPKKLKITLGYIYIYIYIEL